MMDEPTSTEQALEQAKRDYPGLDYWPNRNGKGDSYIVELDGDHAVIRAGMDAKSVEAHINALACGGDDDL